MEAGERLTLADPVERPDAPVLAATGTLFGVGMGPGDPDYLTVRAMRVLSQAPVLVHFCKKGRRGNARTIADAVARDPAREFPLVYPYTTELVPDHPEYVAALAGFYDDAAGQLADHLGAGRDVAILSEGDPFFYGSFMHLWRRLKDRFPVEVVPGVTGMSGCWTRAATPITWGDDVLTVLPATLGREALVERLRMTDAAVIMKLGRHLPKVRAALAETGLLTRAIYVERGTMPGERVVPLVDKPDDAAPYFSMVLVPGEGPPAVSGSVTVIGLGPGDPRLLTAAATEALAQAQDLIGYIHYVARVPERPGLTRHASDNRVEVDRARHALELAASGRRVALVSGGDPGVFAMAAALFEAVEAGDPAWRHLAIAVEPGITAMLAAAARLGAPLGSDFCALSLSDNLKPWEVIVARLDAVLRTDFVIALYNPISSARPWQLGAALGLALEVRPPETPVILARAVTRPDEAIRVLTLAEARDAPADMATLVIIGASATRLIDRGADVQPFVYTPRSVRAGDAP